MAKKPAKKPTRVLNPKKGQDDSGSNLVMITGAGHKVSKDSALTADCGAPRVGWRFGTAPEVTCPKCLRA